MMANVGKVILLQAQQLQNAAKEGKDDVTLGQGARALCNALTRHNFSLHLILQKALAEPPEKKTVAHKLPSGVLDNGNRKAWARCLLSMENVFNNSERDFLENMTGWRNEPSLSQRGLLRCLVYRVAPSFCGAWGKPAGWR